jgi:hypothetical protein
MQARTINLKDAYDTKLEVTGDGFVLKLSCYSLGGKRFNVSVKMRDWQAPYLVKALREVVTSRVESAAKFKERFDAATRGE